ncbi:MAG: CCA tRNA nucleotidyltransferase [Lachnospiraceae bacterium]|jgi:tRNA nucleotidyltransferase (CCA-adding enzyme)|nr:CCA tRNA nucleotidyltransferase [Lachnospiraceae bacterium]
MKEITVPEKVNTVLDTLQDAGFEASIVGGCVRDSLLGRTPDDWDITTSALPAQVKALFRRTVDTGIRHGTVTVLLGRDAFEVTTYRIDGAYEDGRHPTNVTFTASLSEDLKRRDFTVNAMAWDRKKGLTDLFDGVGDLERGVIRAVGDPVLRFGEDALRMMRAVRFAAQLGWTIDPGTAAAITQLAPSLAQTSGERVHAELSKLLMSAHPEEMRTLYATGITAVILPEFDACMRTPQHNPHHRYNVGEHIIHSLQAVRAETVLRWTMLFHDLGKAVCRTTDADGVDHFYGHAAHSAEMAADIMKRLRFDNATAQKVETLVRYHGLEMEATPYGVRKGIVTVGEDLFPLLLEVKEADGAAQSEYRAAEKKARTEVWAKIYAQILAEGNCLTLKDLAVTGRDLEEAGMKPGREMGELLREMLQEVLKNPVNNTKPWLLEHFKYKMRKNG